MYTYIVKLKPTRKVTAMAKHHYTIENGKAEISYSTTGAMRGNWVLGVKYPKFIWIYKEFECFNDAENHLMRHFQNVQKSA